MFWIHDLLFFIISGPTNLQLTHADEAIATATGNFIAGQYIFELQVWDDESLTSKMKLHVDVRDSNSGEMRSTGYGKLKNGLILGSIVV